jgi:hypothetical protein
MVTDSAPFDRQSGNRIKTIRNTAITSLFSAFILLPYTSQK